MSPRRAASLISALRQGDCESRMTAKARRPDLIGCLLLGDFFLYHELRTESRRAGRLFADAGISADRRGKDAVRGACPFVSGVRLGAFRVTAIPPEATFAATDDRCS